MPDQSFIPVTFNPEHPEDYTDGLKMAYRDVRVVDMSRGELIEFIGFLNRGIHHTLARLARAKAGA